MQRRLRLGAFLAVGLLVVLAAGTVGASARAPHKWFTFTNGTHIDSLDPATFVRWYDLLELYVARQAPHLSATVAAFAPALYRGIMGISGVTLSADPIQAEPTYDAALAAFQTLPPLRVLFDNGAGGSTAGAPGSTFEQSFSRFPIPGTHAQSWYLGPGGTLTSTLPATAGDDEFTWNPAALPATDFTGNTAGGPGGLWSAAPSYEWEQNPAGTALSYRTAPLASNTVVIGGGSLQAWIKASAPSVDLQPALPSRLTLPVVPGISVSTPLPPCPSLRGEPCRPYAPLAGS